MKTKTETIRILLADDHAIMRDGLQSLIQAQPDLELVAAVGSGREAVSQAIAVGPDVVVMDIAMPDLNGIDATRKIVSENPHIKILCLTMHKEQSMIQAMFKAGACGYLVKENAGRELLDAIRTVATGETYISPVIADDLVQAYICREGGVSNSIYSELTSREREILQLIAEGRNTKEIAAELDISDKTVAAHRLSLMDKLECPCVADLTRYAIRQGLVKP